jgi:integrase
MVQTSLILGCEHTKRDVSYFSAARAFPSPLAYPPGPSQPAGRNRQGAGVPFLDRHPDEPLFHFCKGGRLYKMLYLALVRAGVVLPRRMRGPHIFGHTYGTWMHRYGGLDTYGLTHTGRWKDPDSANRYKHTMASAEARQADLLPVPMRQIKTQRRS